jgi:hypothetical protein
VKGVLYMHLFITMFIKLINTYKLHIYNVKRETAAENTKTL